MHLLHRVPGEKPLPHPPVPGTVAPAAGALAYELETQGGLSGLPHVPIEKAWASCLISQSLCFLVSKMRLHKRMLQPRVCQRKHGTMLITVVTNGNPPNGCPQAFPLSSVFHSPSLSSLFQCLVSSFLSSSWPEAKESGCLVLQGRPFCSSAMTLHLRISILERVAKKYSTSQKAEGTSPRQVFQKIVYSLIYFYTY